MRGSYTEGGGVKRESSAPYPVPRMANNTNNSNSINNPPTPGGGAGTPGGLEAGVGPSPGPGGVPSPMGVGLPYGGPGVAGAGPNMQTVTLDQVAFQRRPAPSVAGYSSVGGNHSPATLFKFYQVSILSSRVTVCALFYLIVDDDMFCEHQEVR